MPEPKRAQVGIGREIPRASKPVQEMTDEERDGERQRVLKHLEEQVAAGGKNVLDVEIDSGEFQGVIRMKRPTLDEERQVGIRVAKYLQGQVGVDVKTENIATFFAYFDVCVLWDSAPEWFKPREMHDYRLLEYIYRRYAEWLTTFRDFVPPGDQGRGEPTAGTGEVVGTVAVPGAADGRAVPAADA